MEPFCQLEDNKDCFLCVSSRGDLPNQLVSWVMIILWFQRQTLLHHAKKQVKEDAGLAGICTIRYMYILYTHKLLCCAHPNHTKPFIISIPLKAISNYECMNWVKKNNPKVSFWNSMAKNKDVLYLIFEIRLNDSNTTFFSFTVLWIGSKLWQNLV